jgi:hypothetical protein
MPRPLYTRVFSLALSFWLPLFMGGADSIVRCPTHDGAAVVAAHAASGGSSQVADHDHAASHSAPADEGTGHSCLCPGPGCCPPAVAVLPGDMVPLAHIVAVHAAAAVSTLERLASKTDHLLPFATAPPAVALAPTASHTV